MRPALCLAIMLLALILPAARGEGPADVLDKAPSRFATSGDWKVHYKSLGTGDTAVVFVHGWCCDHTVWREQVKALDGKLRLLVVDLPGYGKSEKPKIEYTIQVFAKAVDSVLQDAGVERAVLVGHSMGTPVVRQFYRLFPEKTKGLVFVDGALRPFFKDAAQAEQFIGRFKEETFKESAGQFIANLLTPATPAPARQHLEKLFAAAEPRVAVSSMRGMFDPKLWGDDPIKVPAQALMAKAPFWDADYKAYVKKLAPGLDYREFDGVGHFLFLEKPAEVNAALAEFLKKHGLLRADDAPKKSGPAEPPPVQLTAQQDHKRMMELLGIKSLRPGANPRDPKAPNAVNYDEARANPYPKLPDPLVTKDGRQVTTPQMWFKQRRPEIVEDFDREVYGRVPKETPKVRWEVTETRNDKVGDFAVVTKKLVGHVDNSSYPHVAVDIQLSLTTPADAKGPVSVMMEFGFGGRGFGPPTGARTGPTWQEQVLARGWGYAIIVPNSIQADNGAGLTRGIIGLCNKGRPRQPGDWGALRAWAWGASRALDYFETDKAVDAKRVGIGGLSRYGKAALVAMAYDQRFAVGFIGSSGAGGAKLHRRNFGELVENVASPGEYHWMAGNYLKYAGPLTWDDLPVDAHMLIALCAPRPVFISVGSFKVEGGWIDARGMFLAAVGAGPVYRLLGKKDLGATEMPEQETALIDGDIAFRQHAGGHTTGPNWPTFLKFAERYLTAAPAGKD